MTTTMNTSAITWPENVLPHPSISYKSKNSSNLAVSRFDIGTRQRRRFSADIEEIAVMWNLSHLEYAYFRTFVREDLAQGSKPISISLVTPLGLERITAKIIGGDYSVSYKGFRTYDVSAKLEVINPPILNKTLQTLIAFLEGDTYADRFVRAVKQLKTKLSKRGIQFN